jgi:hypothetical protein
MVIRKMFLFQRLPSRESMIMDSYYKNGDYGGEKQKSRILAGKKKIKGKECISL